MTNVGNRPLRGSDGLQFKRWASSSWRCVGIQAGEFKAKSAKRLFPSDTASFNKFRDKRAAPWRERPKCMTEISDIIIEFER